MPGSVSTRVRLPGASSAGRLSKPKPAAFFSSFSARDAKGLCSVIILTSAGVKLRQ